MKTSEKIVILVNLQVLDERESEWNVKMYQCIVFAMKVVFFKMSWKSAVN